MPEVFQNQIKVGQRVHCILYGGKDGTVVQIKGEQSPDTCYSISGVGVAGGNAHFDIIWDDGTQSPAIPESLIRASVQWRIYDEVFSAQQVADEMAHCAIVAAEKKAKDDEHNEAFRKECDRIRVEYPKLKQSPDETNYFKRSILNMRILLKEQFPTIKFSVRQNHYGSVNVSWKDGPTEDRVDELVQRFSGGHFDGMADIYCHTSTAWTTVFGSADYISTSREESFTVIQKAIDTLWEISSNFHSLDKPTPENVYTGHSPQVPSLDASVAEFVRCLCAYYDVLTGKYYLPKNRFGRTTFMVEYAVKHQNNGEVL